MTFDTLAKIAEISGPNRQVLIAVTADEYFQLSQGTDYKRQNSRIGNNFLSGLGGNYMTYSYLGCIIHVKIDTDLK